MCAWAMRSSAMKPMVWRWRAMAGSGLPRPTQISIARKARALPWTRWGLEAPDPQT